MILRDALDIRRGTAQRNKIYKGIYKVWDKNKIALEGYCKQGVLPSEYQQVEYIESDGNQYIDTGYIPEINDEYEIKFATTVLNYNQVFFGSRTSGEYISSKDQVYLNQSTSSMDKLLFFRGTKSIDLLTLEKDVIYNFKLNLNESDFNNNSSYNIYLFALNRWGESIANSKCRMYSFKFWKNKTLVRDYIPCYRKSDNVIGLYDTVNNVFYTNAGTGTFLKGNDVPNPDYEQPIEVMQGRQVVPIQKNRFDKNNLNYINGFLASDFTIKSASSVKAYYIKCKPNTTYKFLKEVSKYFRVGTTENIPRTGITLLQRFDVSNTIGEVTEYEITTVNNANYLVFNVHDSSVDTATEQEILDSLQIMENSEYTVDLKSKNELNYDLEPENKYYDMNGQPVTISGAVYVNQTINLLTNTTYTFSYEEKIGDAIARLCEYKEDGTFIKRTLIQNNNVSIKLNSETSYVITSTNKAPTSMFIKPQLEEGSEATAYKPYYDYKLAGIGDYKDNFYTDKGKWYFKKNIGNGVLDGNNEWLQLSGSSYGYFNRNLMEDRARGLDVLLSNYFLQIPAVRGVGMYNGQGNIIFCVEDIQTPEDFKTWLSTHNTEVYYRLANAIITEIPSTYTTLINQLNALYQAM